jgi:hypothetical protein
MSACLSYMAKERRHFGDSQEEIMKSSTDQSLFAWTSSSPGYFARHPRYFSQSSNIVPYQSKDAFSTTNKGLHITLSIIQVDKIARFAILACHREGDFHGPIGIRVRAVPGDEENHGFLRTSTSSLVEFRTLSSVRWKDVRPRAIYILKEELQVLQTQSYIWIRTVPVDMEIQHCEVGPHGNGS